MIETALVHLEAGGILRWDIPLKCTCLSSGDVHAGYSSDHRLGSMDDPLPMLPRTQTTPGHEWQAVLP